MKKSHWDEQGPIRKALTMFFVWLYFGPLMGMSFGYIDNAIKAILISKVTLQKRLIHF